MDNKRIKLRLLELHAQEDEMNKEMGRINKTISDLQKKKKKLASRISGNMRFRNRLIEKL